MKYFFLVAFTSVYLCRGSHAGSRSINGGKLLNQIAMLVTHDSGSGEIVEDRDHIVVKWSKTQQGTIIDQLNCGARGLDYRPYLSENGTIYAHHGPTVIFKPMEETLQEIISWGKSNPEELVIMQLSHCVEQRFNNGYYAQSCHDSVINLLNQYNIHTITDSDCSELNTLTYDDFLQKGNILAMFGCSYGYWDPSLTCSSRDYVCYDSWPTNTSNIPWDNLTNSLYYWSSFVPVNDGKLWGFGANWQSSAESVIFGTLHNSSLILDEERSNLNAWTAQAIFDGKFKYINQISVDNICHHGQDIFAAMQEYNANYPSK